VGDHQQIPAHTYGTAGSEQLWSDSYYGQLTGSDYYPELFVGRFSGQNAAEIRTQVNRTLEYEKNPLAGNWMEKAVGIGSDEGAGYGNLGLADWDHMRQIRTKLMAFGYTTVHEFYDGSHGGADAPGNPSAAMLQVAFNEGLGLWNYTGHGWDAGMVTCDYTSTDAINATNYGMYPLVTSVACNNGTFTDGTCVGENFLRANSGGTKGAIGFAGSTILMAWAPPMQTQWEMANIITEQDPANIKRTTGGIFYNGQISMMSEYPGGDGNEVMQTWAYFGDPSTLFRHKQTMPLSFVSPVQVPDATSSLTVTSTTEGARVAISQNNILLGYGFITSGTVTINFPALTTNAPLLVTATKQNHVATQMSVQVGSGALSLSDQTIEVSMYPNPSNETVYFNVNSSESVKFEVISALGQVLSSSTIESNSWTYSVNELPQGVYYARISTSTGVQMLSFQVTK
jgi:gingipain R